MASSPTAPIADARSLDGATRSAQELANRTRNLILPANQAAQIRPEAARFASAPTIDADTAKFGAPAEKKRLLARWQREIGDASN